MSIDNSDQPQAQAPENPGFTTEVVAHNVNVEDPTIRQQEFKEFYSDSGEGNMHRLEIETARQEKERVGRLKYLTGAVACAGAFLVGSDSQTAQNVGDTLFTVGMSGSVAVAYNVAKTHFRLKGLIKDRTAHFESWRTTRRADEARLSPQSPSTDS